MKLNSDRICDLEEGRDGKTVWPYNFAVKILRMGSDKHVQTFPELSLTFNCPCQKIIMKHTRGFQITIMDVETDYGYFTSKHNWLLHCLNILDVH